MGQRGDDTLAPVVGVAQVVLADRDLSRSSVEVSLCGHPARMPTGPAVLAQLTGAALVPATLAYVGREMKIHFHPEVPVGEGVRDAMQHVADAFTTGLREHPEDWHMMQSVFSEDVTVREAG